MSKLLIAVGLALVCAGTGWAQSVDCLDAYETMIDVQEQTATDDPAIWRQLMYRLRSRTEECPELQDLWKLRLELAQWLGDDREVAIAKGRLGLRNGLGADQVALRVTRAEFDPTRPIGKRWALIAGTSEFEDPEISRANPLRYADRDLEQMRTVFESNLGFDDVQSVVGRNFTLAAFRAEIARLRDLVQEDDLLVVYLLSHGVPRQSDPNSVSFILTHDSDNTNSRTLYQTAIGAGALVKEIYGEIRAHRVVLMLDTCYSGDAITGQRDYSGQPAPNLLNRLAGDSGRAVIAASGAGQRSYELTDEAKQGAFVWCFERAVDQSSEAPLGVLFSEVSSCVTRTVRDLGRSQQPVMFAGEAARRMTLSKRK